MVLQSLGLRSFPFQRVAIIADGSFPLRLSGTQLTHSLHLVTFPSLLVIILLRFAVLRGRLGNSIQIPHAGLRDSSTASFARSSCATGTFDLLQDSQLLQCLHHLPVYSPGCIDVVRWA